MCTDMVSDSLCGSKGLLVLSVLLQGLIVINGSDSVYYAASGDDVLITCPSQQVDSWQLISTREFLVLCENGKREINSERLNRLDITANCSLLIQDFSEEYAGVYQCLYTTKDSRGNNKYQIHIQMRKIRIDEAINSTIIKGFEGRPITVTCTAQGVPSNHALYLTKDDKLLKEGMPPSVMYTFTATIVDNQKEIVCKVKNKKDNDTLRTSVRMDLSLKPRVSIVATPNETVRKGNHIGLICQVASDKHGTIEHVLWTHNGQVLQNSTLRLNFQNAGSDIAGVYICTAENNVGKNSASVIVTITFSPVVQSKTLVFQEHSESRTLECNVTGVPHIYTFSKWQHYTCNNKWIRSLKGNANGTLILAEKDPEDVRFEDSGIYICNVTNGIPDDNNNIWTTGKIEVIVNGKPVMSKPEKQIYTGNFNETSSINVIVLSSSSILAAEWFDENNNHLGSNTCFSGTTETDLFGKVVSVSAYKCELLIQNTEAKDFQNYTVQISNQFDKSSFHVSLMATGEPEEPTNIRVLSGINHIYVEFKPGFDGGSPQTFIVAVRKKSSGEWRRLTVKKSYESMQSCYIKNLEQGTGYEIRVYAFNKIGNSTVTHDYTVLTKDEMNSSGTKYIAITIGFTVLVCLFVSWWRFRKAKRTNFKRSSENEQHIQEEHVNINNMNGLAVDETGSLATSAGRTDVYSSIERRMQEADSLKVTNKIAAEGKRCNKPENARHTDRNEIKRNKLKKRTSSKLNYIDVVFDPKPHVGQFCIHGADNRTPYADIDFSAKAEPLISSDEEDEGSTCVDNNDEDFVSLEDIKQWKIDAE